MRPDLDFDAPGPGDLSAERPDSFRAIDTSRESRAQDDKFTKGGIDINPALMNLEVEGGGIQFEVPLIRRFLTGCRSTVLPRSSFRLCR